MISKKARLMILVMVLVMVVSLTGCAQSTQSLVKSTNKKIASYLGKISEGDTIQSFFVLNTENSMQDIASYINEYGTSYVDAIVEKTIEKNKMTSVVITPLIKIVAKEVYYVEDGNIIAFEIQSQSTSEKIAYYLTNNVVMASSEYTIESEQEIVKEYNPTDDITIEFSKKIVENYNKVIK